MKPIARASLLVLALAESAYSQTTSVVGNPMAAHTLFLLAIVGAFLAWAASFSVHTMKERSKEHDRQDLSAHRETVLNQLAELENAFENGEVSPEDHDRRKRALRGELARVIGRLVSVSPGGKKKQGA